MVAFLYGTAQRKLDKHTQAGGVYFACIPSSMYLLKSKQVSMHDSPIQAISDGT